MRAKNRMTARRAPQRRARGFSLLGVLVASAMVVLVVTAVVGLGQRTSRVTRLTRERHIAAFLARESIELVRSLRDDNWLAAPRCTGAPCPIKWRGDQNGTLEEQQRAICNGVRRLDADARQLVLTVPAADDTRLFRNGLVYSHDGGGTLTPFRRWVEIAVVNYALDVGTGVDDCGESYDIGAQTPLRPRGFRVTATVRWTDRGGQVQEVIVGEELHPWLRYR